MSRDLRFDELDAAIELDEQLTSGRPVQLDDPCLDRRATVAGSEIVEHSSRESFMLATGKATLRVGLCEPLPFQPDISAAEAVAGLRETYGVVYPPLATDAEIREASRCVAARIADSTGSGRYRQ